MNSFPLIFYLLPLSGESSPLPSFAVQDHLFPLRTSFPAGHLISSLHELCLKRQENVLTSGSLYPQPFQKSCKKEMSGSWLPAWNKGGEKNKENKLINISTHCLSLGGSRLSKRPLQGNFDLHLLLFHLAVWIFFFSYYVTKSFQMSVSFTLSVKTTIYLRTSFSLQCVYTIAHVS